MFYKIKSIMFVVYLNDKDMIHAIVPDKDGKYSLNSSEYDTVLTFPENGKHPDSVKRFVGSIRGKYNKVLIKTYSPFIVQHADKVFNHNGVEVEDMQRWRVDQILRSSLFGLESLRSVETGELLAEKSDLIKIEHEKPEVASRIKEIDNELGFVPYVDTPAQIKLMQLLERAAKITKHS